MEVRFRARVPYDAPLPLVAGVPTPAAAACGAWARLHLPDGRIGAEATGLLIVKPTPWTLEAVHDGQDLAAWMRRAWPVAKLDQFVVGLLQAESVSQGRRQQQARIGDRALVLERDLDLLQVQLDSVQAGV
jgi:hypothetical protein